MTSRRLLSPTTRLLLDAADYLEKHGLCKYRTSDNRGRVCLVGAINVAAAGDAHIFSDQAQVLVNRMAKHLAEIDVVGWNDRSERTQEEVVSALRAAALEEGESG